MTLAHTVDGAGPPVVLLHAGVADSRMWDPQLPGLTAAGYRVVRCDLPGFGATPPPGRVFSPAGQVAALLDELTVGRASIVGASFGGAVAQQLAADRPDLAHCLTLVCSAFPGEPGDTQAETFDTRETELLEAGDLDAAAELNATMWLGPAADAPTRAAVISMQRHAFDVQRAAGGLQADIDDVDPARLSVPTLVISGAHDFTRLRTAAAHRAAAMPHARHVELDWAGHLPSMERPATFTPLLLDFLTACR